MGHVSLGLISIVAIGFVLGMRHATDADHVVAVSTIVSRERRVGSAALIGLLWGVGHTLTIVAVGVGIIAFELVIPPRLGLSMELSVGVMLVILGFANLRGLKEAWSSREARRAGMGLEPGVRAAELAAGENVRGHSHDGAERTMGAMDRWFGARRLYGWVRPLIVGLVHGLAGSGAVALLVLTTVHDSAWAVAYLLVFGVGTMAGMMLITVGMASALRYAGARSGWINRRLSVATGCISVAFGVFVVYQMGFVHGLFGAHPVWTPQ